jgi:hypothetical protein
MNYLRDVQDQTHEVAVLAGRRQGEMAQWKRCAVRQGVAYQDNAHVTIGRSAGLGAGYREA